MSKVLLSWTQPKSSAPMKNWNWREDHYSMICAALIVIVGIVGCIICDGFPGIGFIAVVLGISFWPNTPFRLVRPTYQLRDNGIRIKNLVTSELCRWENIEWYELTPSYKDDKWLTLYFKARRGKELEWELLDFDCAVNDQSTLRDLLHQKLPDRELKRWGSAAMESH